MCCGRFQPQFMKSEETRHQLRQLREKRLVSQRSAIRWALLAGFQSQIEMSENFVAPSIQLDKKSIYVRLKISLEEDRHALGMGMRRTEKRFPIIGSLLPSQHIRHNLVDATAGIGDRADDACDLQDMLGRSLHIAIRLCEPEIAIDQSSCGYARNLGFSGAHLAIQKI
jgi:hypothetical protein